jgi:hypothetical protein
VLSYTQIGLYVYIILFLESPEGIPLSPFLKRKHHPDQHPQRIRVSAPTDRIRQLAVRLLIVPSVLETTRVIQLKQVSDC